MGMYTDPIPIGVRVIEKPVGHELIVVSELQFDGNDWLKLAKEAICDWLLTHDANRYIIQTKHTVYMTYDEENTSCSMWNNNRSFGEETFGIVVRVNVSQPQPQLQPDPDFF
jgi:hypothetical protein